MKGDFVDDEASSSSFSCTENKAHNSYKGITRNNSSSRGLSTNDASIQRRRHNDFVIHNTANSLELFFQLIREEIDLMRYRLRESGVHLRRFFATKLRADLGRLGNWLAKIMKRSIALKPMQIELPTMLPEAVLKSEWDPPKYTLNNISQMMCINDIEDGVLRHYMRPAWDCLPEREQPATFTHSMNQFQLFNKPLTMTVDEEEERLSLPSTHTTVQDDKLQSIEIMMAKLSKQMEMLMAEKLAAYKPTGTTLSQDAIQPVPLSPCDSVCSSVSPILSDDEGKGASLCSPATSRKGSVPPPPPPPPAWLTSASSCSASSIKGNSLTVMSPSVKIQENKIRCVSPLVDSTEEVVRPSVSDLLTVKLKRTSIAKSPGGTPINRESRITRDREDQGSFLARALREKFRTPIENENEDEKDESAWEEDD